jgi:hypothetical protein
MQQYGDEAAVVEALIRSKGYNSLPKRPRRQLAKACREPSVHRGAQ